MVLLYYHTSTYDFGNTKIYIQACHRTDRYDQRLDVHIASETCEAYRGYTPKDRIGDEHCLSLHHAPARAVFQDVRQYALEIQ